MTVTPTPQSQHFVNGTANDATAVETEVVALHNNDSTIATALNTVIGTSSINGAIDGPYLVVNNSYAGTPTNQTWGLSIERGTLTNTYIRFNESNSAGQKWEVTENAYNYYSLLNTGNTGGVNLQTGTTYAILATDARKLLSFTNSSAIAVSLSQATTTGFTSGFYFDIQNRGAGTLTITPATSTIDGLATLAIAQGQGCRVFSDGTNYYTQRGMSLFYKSPAQTITASGGAALAHNLGMVPKTVKCYIKCTSADAGYSVGDELIVNNALEFDSVNTRGVGILQDATNLTYRFGDGTNPFFIGNKTTSAPSSATNAKWEFYIEARA